MISSKLIKENDVDFELTEKLLINEVNTNISNLDFVDDMGNKRNLLNLFLIIYIFLLISVSSIFYKFRKEKSLLITSVIILFTLPLVVFIQAINSTYFFILADVCESVNQAIYTNKFPVYGKGLGWFYNCHSTEVQTYLYMINNELADAFKIANDDQKISIVEMKKQNLDPILTCDSSYNSLVITESRLCKNGPEQSYRILIVYLFLFLSVLFVGWGFNRFVPIVSKWTIEYNERVAAEESTY